MIKRKFGRNASLKHFTKPWYALIQFISYKVHMHRQNCIRALHPGSTFLGQLPIIQINKFNCMHSWSRFGGSPIQFFRIVCIDCLAIPWSINYPHLTSTLTLPPVYGRPDKIHWLAASSHLTSQIKMCKQILAVKQGKYCYPELVNRCTVQYRHWSCTETDYSDWWVNAIDFTLHMCCGGETVSWHLIRVQTWLCHFWKRSFQQTFNSGCVILWFLNLGVVDYVEGMMLMTGKFSNCLKNLCQPASGETDETDETDIT